MSNILPNLYPVDYTGVSPSNALVAETVTLETNNVRAFSPLYAPFFAKNIRIVDAATGQALTHNQYKLYNLVATASALTAPGDDVYSIVVILDQNVSANLLVDYQTVGGAYCIGYDAITQLVRNALASSQSNPNNPLDWSSVTELPTSFAQTLHLHPLSDTVGWEFIAAQLEQIKLAILLGDHLAKHEVIDYVNQTMVNLYNAQMNLLGQGTPFAQHVLDMDNPHNVTPQDLGLNNVQNYPVATLAEAYAGATQRYLTADIALAVVQNQINHGMDAHILDLNNPHQVTKAQIGLTDVENYPVAVAADITTPDAAHPKYVTNAVLGSWLASYLTAKQATVTTEINNFSTAISNAQTAANSAATSVASLAALLPGFEQQLQDEQALAQQALDAALQNSVDAQNVQASAVTLIQQYAAQAIAAAQTTFYQKGYEDGQAATVVP